MDSHHIAGEAFGNRYFLTESGPIDFSTDHNWTTEFSKRKLFTFDQACEVMDEEFHEGLFEGIAGIITLEEG